MSLARIMLEIKTRPRAITRDYWVGQWRDDPNDAEWIAREAARGWSEQYARATGDYLDPAIPTEDFDRLSAASAKVNRFVNEHIAHSQAAIRQPDRQRPAEVESVSSDVTLSAKEVHEVIDLIGELYKKYYNLLTASSYVFLVPVIQHDWMAAFRMPWMRPGWEPPSDSP